MKHYLTQLACVAIMIGLPFSAKAIDLKDGDKIAVLTGQSFDIWNWSPSGYMRLLTDELAKVGVKQQPWILLEGQKTEQMLARIEADVIEKKPLYVFIIPGTADYNPFAQRKVDDEFIQNLTGVIEKLKAANIKTILVTSYASNANLAFSPNENVGEHNEAIRTLAQDNQLPLIDFVQVVDNEKGVTPFDGNLAAKGLINQMFAGEVLRSLGWESKDVDSCREAWLDKPGAIEFMPSVSVNTYEKLKAGATASGKDVGSYLTEVLREKTP